MKFLPVTLFRLGFRRIKVQIQHRTDVGETITRGSNFKQNAGLLHPTLRRILGNVNYKTAPTIDSRPFHMVTDGSVKDSRGGGGVALIDSGGN